MTAPDDSSDRWTYFLVTDRYSKPGNPAGVYRTAQDDDGNEHCEFFGRTGAWMPLTGPPEGVLREIPADQARDTAARMRRNNADM